MVLKLLAAKYLAPAIPWSWCRITPRDQTIVHSGFRFKQMGSPTAQRPVLLNTGLAASGLSW